MKRFLPLLIALALVMSLMVTLSACKKDTIDDGENNNDNTEENVQGGGGTMIDGIPDLDVTPVPQADPSSYVYYDDVPGANGDENAKLQKFEFPSDKVVFLSHYEMDPPDGKRPSSELDIYQLKRETNVVPPDERLNKFISMVMSNDAPDIFIYDFIPTLATKGYLAPWNTYINFNDGVWAKIKSSLDNLKYKEHFYSCGILPGRWDMVWYNINLFEEYGQKTPLEYYREGNWNWDTFRECAKAMTIDIDQDGSTDIYGGTIGSQFINTTGKDFITINSDGTATNNMGSPEIARAMQFYIDLTVKDKCLYIGNDATDLFKTSRLAMYMSGASLRSSISDSMIRTEMVFFVPLPKDPTTDKYYVYEGFGGSHLPMGAPNPQGAAAIQVGGRYDYIDQNPEYTDEEYYEYWDWSRSMDDFLWAEMYGEDKAPVLSTIGVFNLYEFWGDIWYRTTQGEPWSAISAELFPRVQDVIDRAMDID